MKKMFVPILFLSLLTGCDAPQRSRLAGSNVAGVNTLGLPSTTTSGSFSGVVGTTTGSTTGSTTGTTNALTSKPGFQTCTALNPLKYTLAGGNLDVCQSVADETQLAVLPTFSDTDPTKTCLIPTYKDTAGSSTYLGQPQCFSAKINSGVIGALVKNRTGFTQFPINGVIIMKSASLTAYFTCMDAYATFIAQNCPAPYTNANCTAAAQTNMANLCNQFKASNPYLDIRLK